jgi:hypothetical protein
MNDLHRKYMEHKEELDGYLHDRGWDDWWAEHLQRQPELFAAPAAGGA